MLLYCTVARNSKTIIFQRNRARAYNIIKWILPISEFPIKPVPVFLHEARSHLRAPRNPVVYYLHSYGVSRAGCYRAIGVRARRNFRHFFEKQGTGCCYSRRRQVSNAKWTRRRKAKIRVIAYLPNIRNRRHIK